MKFRKFSGMAAGAAVLSLLLVLTAATFKTTPDTPAPNSHPAAALKYVYFTFDDGPLNGSENIDSVILAERLK